MKENRQGCLSRINQAVFHAFTESMKYFETGEKDFFDSLFFFVCLLRRYPRYAIIWSV